MSRARTSHASREATHIKNVRSENSIRHVSPENTEKSFKIKTVTINAPYLGNMGDRLVQRYVNQPQIVKSITSTNNSFNMGKSKSYSDQFYFPPKSFALTKKNSEDYGELVPSRTRNPSYPNVALPMNLNTRQKVKISQFLLDGSAPNSPLDPTSNTAKARRRAYKASNSLSGILLSRPGTNTLVKRRPSIRTGPSEQSLTFKTRLALNEQEDSTEVLRQIRSFGTFKKKMGGLAAQPGFFTVQAPEVSLSPKIKNQEALFPKNFWFTLNHDVATKTTLEHQIAEKKRIMNTKEVNKKTIHENKDKWMVCLDTNFHNGPLKYCFLRKELYGKNNMESPVSAGIKLDKEFKIRLCEIQTKMRLGSDFRFLYLVDGTPFYNWNDVPSDENIVVISKSRKLGPIHDIIQNDLVRDFYEYHNQRDNTLYFKHHADAKMTSLLETIENMEKKYQRDGGFFQTEKQIDLDGDDMKLVDQL